MIRRFPYPFTSALAIVSDVDNASKARYEGYIGEIVRKHGLDFGDSTWLRMSCEAVVEGIPVAYGLGFFSRHFGVGNSEALGTFTRVRTFNESIAEYHLGNLDHFHTFVSQGPRVAILGPEHKTDSETEFKLPRCETKGFWRCTGAYIDAICVVYRGGTDRVVDGVLVTDRAGAIFDFRREVPAPIGGERERRSMFVAFGSASDDRPHPRLDEIARVSLELACPSELAQIVRVLLVSASSHILIDRLRFLHDRYNVEMALVTEHSGLHFRSKGMAAHRDAEQDEYIATHPDNIAALNGAHRTEKNGVIFSTDADDPASVARLLPELSTEFEVRFFVPRAATSPTGLAAEGICVPFSTRVGTAAYQVHRMLPNLSEPANKALFDGTRTRQENFVARLQKVLDAAENNGGLCWPIYTHLGGISEPIPDHQLPSPYFDGDALCRLQDRTFNISGTLGPNGRIWTARATTLYDYALIRRSIADHVTCTDGNTIEIASWDDPVLGKTLPRSPAQLYGLTFYVDDSARGRVNLDGNPIRLLTRNPKDETGRCSVTIAEAEISHLVFEGLNPLQNNVGGEVEAGSWCFFDAKSNVPAFGRLSTSGSDAAALRLPMFGWVAEGAQLLSFLGRRSAGADLAVTLDTVSGGRFFFGDLALLRSAGPLTAYYIFEYDQGSEFRSMVAPFHCMRWNESSAPGGPMPNHPLNSVTLHCGGGWNANADFGNIRFLRPRATSLHHRDKQSYCLGGRVEKFKAGQIVQVCSKDEVNSITTKVDQRGMFCCSDLAPDIYTVWTEDEGSKIYDRRGALVELRSDLMTLHLSRKG